VRKAGSVESGEGIESFSPSWWMYSRGCPSWNPEKELKVLRDGRLRCVHRLMWNPEKELKEKVLENEGRRVPELVESGEGIERHNGVINVPQQLFHVESGEGIERQLSLLRIGPRPRMVWWNPEKELKEA